jgi:hypothetical protein
MGRKRGSRFRKAADAQEQYEQIEARQRKAREGKIDIQIDSIKKSQQRETNYYKRIKDPGELGSEFDAV